MSSYKDRKGVWVTYSYDQIPYVMTLHEDVVDAARECAQEGYGRVLFWPYGTTFMSAVQEWEKKEEEPEKREKEPTHLLRGPGSWLTWCEANGPASTSVLPDTCGYCLLARDRNGV